LGVVEVSKQHIRLYPDEIEKIPWIRLENGADGIVTKLLTMDEVNGSSTRLVQGVAGCSERERIGEHCEELYVLEGTLSLGSQVCGEGSYVCRSPGSLRPELVSDGGFVAIQVLDVPHAGIDKHETVLSAVEIQNMPWKVAPNGNPAHLEKVLSSGASGSVTRLLRVELGGDTTDPDDHDHDEEVLILEGTVQNGDEIHPAGTYTFNLPHDVHGPFAIIEPLLCYEIRNY
jgi:hypothetical protein